MALFVAIAAVTASIHSHLLTRFQGLFVVMASGIIRGGGGGGSISVSK